MEEIFKLPAKKILELLRKGELSPYEVLESFYNRFLETEDKVRAFITPLYGKKLEELKGKRLKDGKLFGIPVALKDNILLEGVRNTCGSKILENFVAPYNATVVERLKKEGAVFVGKTNMDEFAMGSSTEYSAFFKTRNPFDLERVPGGSSGGSAVCVSVFQCPISLGSDTGGSIRQPASFCGVLGIKPTYGRVSRYGLVAFASSLDQIGVFARHTEDLALALEVISGYDERDSTSAPIEVPPYSELLKEERKFRLGVVKELEELEIDEEVRESFNGFLKEISKEFEIVEVSLPTLKYAIPAYYIIAPSEASSNLARYDGVRFGYRAKDYKDLWEMYSKTRGEGFGKEVKRRIIIGTFSLSTGYYEAYYLRAQRVRTKIYKEFLEALKKVDLILTPTSPTLPFKIGERLKEPVKMYLSDLLTVPVSLAGLPALSLPIDVKKGLPVGAQVIGGPFEETKILQFSYYWEKTYEFPKKVVPKL